MLKKGLKKLDAANLKAHTHDQRAEGRDILDRIQQQTNTLAERKKQNAQAWATFMSQNPGKVDESKVNEKLAGFDADLKALEDFCKKAVDKYNEISARPNDGSTSASSAKADCDRLLGELKDIANKNFDVAADKLSKALTLNIDSRSSIEAKIAQEAAETEANDFLMVPKPSGG